MKLNSSTKTPNTGTRERRSWVIYWLPLSLALLVSVFNVILDRRSNDVENEHVVFLNLELQLADVDGLLDTQHSGPGEEQDITNAETLFQTSVVGLTNRDHAYAPTLSDLAHRYHETFERQVALYEAGRDAEAFAFDRATMDPQKDRMQAALMGAHRTLLQETTNMQNQQTVFSTLAVFGLAISTIVMFIRFDRTRRQTAETKQALLQGDNKVLEEAVLERTKEIEHQAFHDKLTGLANRALFQDRIAFALKKAKRTHLGTATLFLDLDNFKIVNDSLGHAAGDELLISVADRLTKAVRPGDTVARMGGDEFTVLLEDLESCAQAESFAARILTSLLGPMKVQGREAFALGSIGIAYTMHDSMTAEDMMKNADTAMYRAKANGKACYVVWEETMNHMALERMELETDLHKAMENGEISVHYQPLINLSTGRLGGAEALARWRHPTRGFVPPAQFIPIAEESGMIHTIGYWVLEEACKRAARWQSEFQLTDFTMCVNLSGRQLQSKDVVERIAEILERTGLEHKALKIEITESVLMSDREDVVAKMQRLHGLGIKLALDDFGTGYSSLSRLSVFPVDTLKIDRLFVSQLGNDVEADAVVEAIIALSKSMKMDVVGEGVETEQQMAVLRSLGCQTGQGFLFAKALTAADFGERLLKVGTTGHWDDSEPDVFDQLAA